MDAHPVTSAALNSHDAGRRTDTIEVGSNAGNVFKTSPDLTEKMIDFTLKLKSCGFSYVIALCQIVMVKVPAHARIT